jgi:hypothetical protein
MTVLPEELFTISYTKFSVLVMSFMKRMCMVRPSSA